MMSVVYGVAGRLPPGFIRWVGRVQLRSPLLRRLIQRLRPNGVVTISHGPGKGIRILATDQSNVGYALGTTEPEVQRFFAETLRPGDVVYDIGANVGFFTLIAARLVGETGRVYAFEPLPSNVDALRKNIALNGFRNVEVIPAAVGDRSGTAKLLLGHSSLDSRLSVDGEARSGIDVPVVSLDRAEIERAPTLVKIDVEGAEYSVIDGMRDLLSTNPTILCELHQQRKAVDHLDALSALLGDDAGHYELELLEGADDWWAPHAVATPR